MAHSIAAKYAARPAARFVRPTSRTRERRLGLGGPAPFSAARPRATVLRGPEGSSLVRLLRAWRGPRTAHRVVTNGRPRHAVQMHWAASARGGSGDRPSAATAPWHA